jgi:ribosome-associated toxin RatA of RatAB toxin-antitoxin module
MIATVNRIGVHAPAQRIYEMASATERWPVLLPHYRFVRVLSGDGDNERTVEMAARRGCIPVRWIAVQHNDPKVPSVAFHHIAGWTKGMDVLWRFEESNGETIVSISHWLDFAFPIGAAFLEKHVVAGYFIDGVATRTLAQMKRLAEEIHV